MSYWWVNQSQSWAQERAGSYMWAPLRDGAGHRPGHWEAMTDVRLGDIVFHYASGAIRAVGTVTAQAELAPRPADLPESWEREGRVVRVAVVDATPHLPLGEIDLDARLAEIGGPFDRNGDIKQGYLYPLSGALGLALLHQVGATVGPIDPAVETVLIEDEQVAPGLPGKELREAIERYAVDAILGSLGDRFPGCRVKEMKRTNPGYDIEVACPDRTIYVEVKGTMARGPVFVLSERERSFSADHADHYEIHVVWGIDLEHRTHAGTETRAGEVRPDTHGLTPWKWQGRLPGGGA